MDVVEVAIGTKSFPRPFSAGNGKVVVGIGKTQRDNLYSNLQVDEQVNLPILIIY